MCNYCPTTGYKIKAKLSTEYDDIYLLTASFLRFLNIVVDLTLTSRVCVIKTQEISLMREVRGE